MGADLDQQVVELQELGLVRYSEDDGVGAGLGGPGFTSCVYGLRERYAGRQILPDDDVVTEGLEGLTVNACSA